LDTGHLPVHPRPAPPRRRGHRALTALALGARGWPWPHSATAT